MYAQILKRDMRVNLIGGAAEGLPIEHPEVICIDISGRSDVALNMKYDSDTGTFYKEPTHEPSPETPTIEDRMAAVEEALLMIL
jgi:hypothetical protein